MEPMIERIGGESKVHLLVNHFYDLIETLPLIEEMGRVEGLDGHARAAAVRFDAGANA